MALPVLSLPLTQMVPWLIEYRYPLLFSIMIFEGPIITIIAGFLLSLGYLEFSGTYAVAVTADLVGDTLFYLVGRIGTHRFVDRWGNCVGVIWDQIERVRSHFEKHAGKTLLLGKLTHGVGGLILVAAGVAEVPYRVFLWFNLLGTLPKSFVLLVVGFYFGHGYLRMNTYLNGIALITISVFLLAGLAFLFYGTRKGREL